ncbi:MAG TPA: hypothetical protein VHF27_05190 [Acidimicrobiales bacterium]|nr:hypothetical protein [Acidimicrobiales bacterium]
MAAVLALSVLSAACGGSSGDQAAGVATAGDGAAKNGADDKDKRKTDPEQAGLDFARCMREHGVDVPDPKPGEGGFVMIGPAPGSAAADLGGAPPPGFAEAEEACRHHLEGLIQDGGGPIDPKEQDRALAFARCMREHGVNMPDPDFSSGGGVRIEIGGEGMNPSSPTFQEAQKACGSLFGPGQGSAPGVAPRARS